MEQGEAEDVAVIGRSIAVAHLRENQADVAFLQRVVLFVDGGAKFAVQHIDAFETAMNMRNVVQVLQHTVCIAALAQIGVEPFLIGHYQAPPDCNP